MIPLLFDHLWQSTVVLAAIGLLTLFFRNNGAHVRHALWTAASLKFLVPFALLTALGGFATHLLSSPLPAPPVLERLHGAAQPFSMREFGAVSASTPMNWMPLLAAVWMAGFLTICTVWLARWWKLRAVVHAAHDAAIAGPMPVKVSAAPLEPGLVGILRPVLLLPEGIAEKLAPAELQSIITHEACHLRRRDNLLAALHMLVEAVFWFWPPVWWLGARLIVERERACDEAVLASGSDPQVYAESILKVCKFYVQSPLACAAGIAGANLKRRMEAIMECGFVANLNGMKKTLLGASAAALVLTPIAAGIWSPAEAQGRSCTPNPVASTHTLPPYPAESAKAGETGTVMLQVTLARNGHVNGASVARSSGFARLDEAAVSYVRQHYLWRPNPCGEVRTQVRVVYSLASHAAKATPANP